MRTAAAVFRSFFKITDYKRWTTVNQEANAWSGRNILIASIIPSGSSVLDLGAGTLTLQQYLKNCDYQPCDLYQSTPDTIYCNFNKGIYPMLLHNYDYVVCSGLLEYIRDPREFLSHLPNMGENIILSYAILLPHHTLKSRLTMGWFSHFTQTQLENLFESQNFQYEICGHWNEQLIYNLREISSD